MRKSGIRIRRRNRFFSVHFSPFVFRLTEKKKKNQDLEKKSNKN
jgi:hypothetical protein